MSYVILSHELFAAPAQPLGHVGIEGRCFASQAGAHDDAPPVVGLDRDSVHFAVDLACANARLGHDRADLVRVIGATPRFEHVESRALGADCIDEDIEHKTMRFTVHPRCRLGIGRIHETEDLPRLLIDPIPFVVHAIFSLRLQVGLMRSCYVARRYAAIQWASAVLAAV